MTFRAAVQATGLTPSDGLQAIAADHKVCIVTKKGGAKPTGSVDMDAAYSAKEPHANRWDYGIGFQLGGTEFTVWVEPHSATSSHEVTTMIKKLLWLKEKLGAPDFLQLRLLTDQTGKANQRRFWWVTAGKINIRRGTVQEKQLAKFGLNYPVRSFRLGLD